MNKNPVLFSKILVISIIILLIGTSTVPINRAYTTTSATINNNGSLLGYVNDTSGNPIEGALVRVYFHETYEEDYSDSNGFYHVTNISICWCMKNTTCSKEGYKTEWVLLSIVENTTYDFVLTEGNNDTTPPVTTHTLDPPEPDGNNGWYVSDVNVTLTATDDKSGVKEIRYMVDGGPTQVLSGDNGSFILDEDGWDILIEYWAIDNAGNVETPKNFFTIDIDQTFPDVNIPYNSPYYDINLGWIYNLSTWAEDEMSGMDYVEFYRNNELLKTVFGPGPQYFYNCEYSNITHFWGIIRNAVFTSEYIKFKAIFIITNESTGNYSYIHTCAYDKAGNMGCDGLLELIRPGPFYKILILKSLTLPNNYTGYIGRFLISATFNTN